MGEVKASVILPCYNRAELLPLSLTSLKSQSISLKDYEVLIVDDGSTDGTQAVVRSYLWGNARYLRKSNGGASSARNHGIMHARGEVLIFSDPDMLTCPHFIEKHIAHHSAGSADVVIGKKKEILAFLPWWMPAWPVRPALKKLAEIRPDLFRRAVSALFKGKMRRLLSEADVVSGFHSIQRHALSFYLPEPPPDMSSITIPWVFLVSGNFSVSSEMLQQVGGFDENFTGWGLEDIELGYRLHRNAARFVYEPNAVNYHQTHGFNLRGNDSAADRNLRYFMEKHPCREVELHADFVRGQISFQQYDNLVREYYRHTGHRM